MSKFIITEWVIKPFDYEFTTKTEKLADLNYKFRILDDDNNVYAYGYSESVNSLQPLRYCKKYGCTKIEYM